MKLGVQSQIGSHSINPGEFIALMPFTKKEKSRNVQCEGSGVALQTTQQGAPSSLAESAWRDMMEDLSYLSNTVSSEEQSGCLPNSSSDKSKDEASDKKHTKNYSRKRRRKVESKAGLAEDLISSLLLSSKNSVLDEDVCGKFLQVLESVHCLSDAETGNCMLLSKVDMQENGQPYQPSCSCLCPPWLTIMMKTFTFLNIFAGFLQVHHESVMMTFDLVNDSLDKLRELGFCASVEDLKRLPDLCPKVCTKLFAYDANLSDGIFDTSRTNLLCKFTNVLSRLIFLVFAYISRPFKGFMFFHIIDKGWTAKV